MSDPCTTSVRDYVGQYYVGRPVRELCPIATDMFALFDSILPRTRTDTHQVEQRYSVDYDCRAGANNRVLGS